MLVTRSNEVDEVKVDAKTSSNEVFAVIMES